MKILSGFLALAVVASVQCATVPSGKLTNVESDVATANANGKLPGREVTPGEQCQDRHYYNYGGVCKTTDPATRCSQLICAELLRTSKPEPLETGPALDGTWCGDKKICFKGSCVDDPQPPENPLKIIDFQYDCKRPSE